MKKSSFSFVISVLIVQSCIAAIVIDTPVSKDSARLYGAAIDVLMTCYEDRNNAVGIVGDGDGSILKKLWSNYTIPVVMVDTEMNAANRVTVLNLHRLQVFLIAAATTELFESLMEELSYTIWWNHNANFLILNPEMGTQCTDIETYLFVAYQTFSALNAQLICFDNSSDRVMIFNSNPFTPHAPKPWKFSRAEEAPNVPFNIFSRKYEEGPQKCESLNFAKTTNVGGYPFYFVSNLPDLVSTIASDSSKPTFGGRPRVNEITDVIANNFRLIIHNIVTALNASAVVTADVGHTPVALHLRMVTLSSSSPEIHDCRTYPLFQMPLYAITRHTGHMSQLEKILSVIDRPSRIAMWLVYLITFLFFKLFLRQAVAPAVLNLVRLTCGTGLTKLPRNLGPKIYLACLFMFVVTLQAIYTGDLASLLTTTIPYRHANTKQDLVDLGHTIYTMHVHQFGDSMFDGRVVKISSTEECHRHISADPLAACVVNYYSAVLLATKHNLHMSADPIMHDYVLARLTRNNHFGRRLDAIFAVWNENRLLDQLLYEDIVTKLSSELVDDDEVKKNTFRRVMTMADLRFAFVILGVGLTCSFGCFVGEVVVCRVRLKIANRRARNHVRLAWAVTEYKFTMFSALRGCWTFLLYRRK